MPKLLLQVIDSENAYLTLWSNKAGLLYAFDFKQNLWK